MVWYENVVGNGRVWYEMVRYDRKWCFLYYGIILYCMSCYDTGPVIQSRICANLGLKYNLPL